MLHTLTKYVLKLWKMLVIESRLEKKVNANACSRCQTFTVVSERTCGNAEKKNSISGQTDFISYIISTYTWSLPLSCRTSSLRPCLTVDKWLRLLSRPMRFSEKRSDRPAEHPGLRGRAVVSLEDCQSSDDEPEEEVDPHRRLRREQRRMKNEMPKSPSIKPR